MFHGIIPNLLLWHGFLEEIVKPERANQESCAWIFADLTEDVWHIIQVKNVGLKYFGKTQEEAIRFSFAPDKKDFARIKRVARKYKYTKIGCVHTHVIIGDDEEEVKHQSRPSDTDLVYARKFNDIVRAILVVQFRKKGEVGEIRDIIWFDQYGHILNGE